MKTVVEILEKITDDMKTIQAGLESCGNDPELMPVRLIYQGQHIHCKTLKDWIIDTDLFIKGEKDEI